MLLQLPDLAALASAEANGYMGLQHALQYTHLPADFAAANALGVNLPVPLASAQRLPQEPVGHQMDGRASNPGAVAPTHLSLALPDTPR
jgi:hypothetical protein